MSINPKKRITNDRYNAKCTQINIKPLTQEAEAIKKAASNVGQSLQGYILQACRERMEREGYYQENDSEAKTNL